MHLTTSNPVAFDLLSHFCVGSPVARALLARNIASEYCRKLLEAAYAMTRETCNVPPQLEGQIPFEVAWSASSHELHRALVNGDKNNISTAVSDLCVDINERAMRPSFEATAPVTTENFTPELTGDTDLVHVAARQVRQAFELLMAVNPDAAAWVALAVSRIRVVPTEDLAMVSGSDPSLPREIAMSVTPHAAATAELLIHESSHQYLHLAELVECVTNGDDDRLYFSPLKGTVRPLRALLLAYHALGNMTLFFDDSLHIPQPAEHEQYCQDNLQDCISMLNTMRRDIENTSGLSPAGRSLFVPLSPALRSRNLIK